MCACPYVLYSAVYIRNVSMYLVFHAAYTKYIHLMTGEIHINEKQLLLRTY